MKMNRLVKLPVISSVLFTFLPGLASAQTVAGDQTPISQIVGSWLLLGMVIGVLYNLWKTTKAYGSIIGQGLRRIGMGILFLTVEAMDRMAQNFSGSDLIGGFIPKYYLQTSHDALLLTGLFFLILGFSKLSSAMKN